MGIMTTKEAAEKWGISPRRVGIYIRDHRIKGAFKVGAAWVIPENTKKPSDLRHERRGKNRKYRVITPFKEKIIT